MPFTLYHITKNAFSMMDMMMSMQRLSLRAASADQPFVPAFLASTKALVAARR